MIDISRRAFIFGAAATLIMPPPRKFFIVEGAHRLIRPGEWMRPSFDLPMQQMLDLQKKLDEQVIEVTALPRWLFINPAEYDRLVRTA